MKIIFWLVAGVLLFSSGIAAQQADIVLHNGKILTVDRNFTTAEGIAITGNKISAVGSSQSVLQQAGPNTLKIDLKGRTVVPGLIDTHLHITGPGAYASPISDATRRSFTLDWRAVNTKQDVLNQIRSVMERYKPPSGDWLSFGNRGADTPAKIKILYDELNANDLTSVLPNNPALFSMGIPEENGLFVNRAALDILFSKHGDFIRKYGRYWLGSNGQPDGHLEPPATRLILNSYAPRRTAEESAPGIAKRLQELNGQGHTTISTKLRMTEVDAYKILEQRGEQTVRLAYGMGFDHFGSVEDPVVDLKKYAGIIGTGTDLNWVSSFAPSSLDGASTRACTNQKRSSAFGVLDSWWPVGQCHTDNEFRGGSGRASNIPGNYFKDFLMTMGQYNLRLANDHVAGDRTVANLLSMIEQIRNQHGPNSAKGWAFDHCTLVDPKDFQRAARLGVMFSCAPKYIESVAPEAAVSYGDQVANSFVVPVKSLIDAGARVVYEADRDTYVWEDLELLLTRKDEAGKVWGPQERLDKTTALKMATIWAADYVLRPDKLGSIETGKLADIAVLDKDYLTIPAENVSDIQPQLTIMDGKIVFVHTNFANEYSLRPQGAIISTFQELKGRRPQGGGEQLVGEGGG
jgi:predicted amidohydrolase YtcJ